MLRPMLRRCSVLSPDWEQQHQLP